jgi:hypothetical protein
MVVTCCAVAALLNLGLTKFDTRFTVTYCDYHSELKRGPTADPIIPLGSGVADTMCIGLKSPSDRVRWPAAFIQEYGVFARSHVPPILALCMGFIAPLLLILFAAYLALQRASLKIRRTVSVALLLPGSLFTMAIGFVVFQTMHLSLSISSIAHDSSSPILIVVLALAIICMFGGIWLWLPQSPKEPI